MSRDDRFAPVSTAKGTADTRPREQIGKLVSKIVPSFPIVTSFSGKMTSSTGSSMSSSVFSFASSTRMNRRTLTGDFDTNTSTRT
jgi:hypothetical protein